jgi:hypothetical protein
VAIGEHDPFDEREQAAARASEAEAKRLERNREVDDFKWLMGHRQGRRFMWRLLGMTGLYRNPHIPGTDDVLFRCGEQNIGQRLNAEIHGICPEHYPVMVKEHQEWLKKQQQ